MMEDKNRRVGMWANLLSQRGVMVGLHAGLSSALPPSRTRALSASIMCILTSTFVLILGQG